MNKKMFYIIAAIVAVFAFAFIVVEDIGDIALKFTRFSTDEKAYEAGKAYTWDEVLKGAGEAGMFTLTYSAAEEILDENVMVFLAYASFQEKARDYLPFYESSVYDMPPSMAMKVLLLGAEYKKHRSELVKKLTDHLLSPPMEARFYGSRDSAAAYLEDWLKESPDSASLANLPSLIAALKTWNYQKAVVTACDYYTEMINKVDYNKKVVLESWGMWYLINKKDGENLDLFEDNTPMKMVSLFYRLGPKAGKEIKVQLSAVRGKAARNR